MKRILLAGLLSMMAVASGAFAQTPMAGYDWNGPYLGINGGMGWIGTNFQYTTPPIRPLHSNGSGGLVGGTFGGNWQFDPHWLVGIEGDGDWSSISGSTSCPNPAFSCRTNLEDFATLRLRGGYV